MGKKSGFGSGIGKKSGFGSGIRAGMNNSDHISESLETIFWVKQFFDADLGPVREKIRVRVEKIRIRDKHPGSATTNCHTGKI